MDQKNLGAHPVAWHPNGQIRVAAAQYPITFFREEAEFYTKTEAWVREAVFLGASYLLFPEYGAMELTSLLPEAERADLKSQARGLRPFVESFLSHFSQLAKKYQCYILAPSLPIDQSENLTTNRVYIFSPTGQCEYQDKIFMTRFEDEEWGVQGGEPEIKIFETANLKFAVATCFDVEFAFPALAAAQNGAQVLFVPSCTETVRGANRVHIGARARALENQMYVVVSQTVGQARWSPAVDENNGFAAVYATPDTGFPEDGIINAGAWNKEQWLTSDLNLQLLENVRKEGRVFNFKTHQNLVSQGQLSDGILQSWQIKKIKF